METTEAAGRQPLPIELHAATRTEHANLNRTIMTRLPLCLPNATTTSALYAKGIATFGQIYAGIEEAQDTLLSRENLSLEQRNLVTSLLIPQLRRTKRLQSDLGHLSQQLGQSTSVKISHLQSATSHVRHAITESILEKPHLLLAYTWTMYLALFNGGRFIAKQLLSAGTLFWKDEDRARTVRDSLSFWFFGDSEDYDGEDLKILFKDRFNHVAATLTDTERDEVIAESKKLFSICGDLVELLDRNTAETSNVERAEVSQNILSRYLAAVTPASVMNIWQSVSSRMPLSSQNMFPVSLRQEVDQKHG